MAITSRMRLYALLKIDTFLTLMGTGLLEFKNLVLKHACFWDADGNRKWAFFPFNLFSHNYIYIAMYLFFIRDD